jgi:hypothetical protein
MRVSRFGFLFTVVLALALGAVSANAADDKHFPKGMGSVTIRTTPASYPVKIDGEYRGMSGVSSAAEFFLSPGLHTIEVGGPNGSSFLREIEIRREAKHCICLKLVEETITRACPYRFHFHLEGPDRIQEGDLVTFAAINSGTAPIPLRYAWRVSSGRVTSGLGTPTITVDSTGIAGQTIMAELDVNDDTYDNKCRQVISVPTEVTKIPDTPPPPKPFRCDEFESRSADEDKARLDNCVIQVQNTPGAQLYVIIYPGTDRLSTTRNTYERLSKRALDYMVKNRGLDPRNLQIVKGTPRTKTTYEIWIVPPGATPPVPQ